MEDTYGLNPIEVEEDVFLSLPANSTLRNDIQKWHKEITELKNGNISQEEYNLWRYSYPRIEAERAKEKLTENRKEKRTKNQSDSEKE